MWVIDLDSVNKCRDLCNMCARYKDIKVDLSCKRYLVDAQSFLGVLSLLHHRVTLIIHGGSNDDRKSFVEELEKLGGEVL